jgi:hypothetical protein
MVALIEKSDICGLQMYKQPKNTAYARTILSTGLMTVIRTDNDT